MPFPAKITSLFRSLFHKERQDSELDAELRSYLDMLTEEKIKAGLSPEQARRQARIELGGMEQVKMKVREVRFGTTLETVWQDIRYGLRMLRKNPGFTAVAVLTLALGIGANTTMFSIINTVLLQPLPFPNPDRLVALRAVPLQEQSVRRGVAYPNLLDWQEQNQSFEGLAGTNFSNFALTGEGEPEMIPGQYVSWNYFSLLGVRPLKGRFILPEEDKRPMGESVTVLSHTIWENRFGSDPDIVGKAINLNGKPHTIIGVTPEGFGGVGGFANIWVPITTVPSPLAGYLNHRGARWIFVVGKMKDGVAIEQAQAEMTTIADRLREDHPRMNEGYGVAVLPVTFFWVADLQQPLTVLSAAVGFVLLIACANVANLLLSRATQREKEIAIRAALGATRARIVRQLLVESVLLSLAGGTLGLLMAAWGVDLAPSLLPGIPAFMVISLNSSVLLFTFVLCIGTGLLFGLAPAFRLSGVTLHDTLKEGGRSGSGGSNRQAFRNLLVLAEIALALVLLVGAGLLLRTFEAVRSVDLGFDPSGVLTTQVNLPQERYPKERIDVFARRITEKIGALPGVESASASSDFPLSFSDSGAFVQTEDNTDPDLSVRVWHHAGTAGFFRSMGISLRRGRFFAPQDTETSQRVVILNEAAAKEIWPGEDPLGKKIQFSSSIEERPWLTVVGVVEDVRYRALTDSPASGDPDVYYPLSQSWRPVRTLFLSVRTSGDAASYAPQITDAVRELDSNMPIFNIAPLEQAVGGAMQQERTVAILLGAFSFVALVLATIGIYGVISYSVSYRTHEIGIRMALGAQPRDIFKLVVGQGMALALIGVGVGLAGAFALTRFLESLLFGVTPTDPSTFAGVSLLMAAVALLACYLPARRATRVDPMVALRYE